MRYKLIDARTEHKNGVQFGTCELCMSVGVLDYEVYELEDENGKKYEFESGYWSWGDWMTYSWEEITNVIDFASWINNQELREDMTEETFWDLYRDYTEMQEENNE